VFFLQNTSYNIRFFTLNNIRYENGSKCQRDITLSKLALFHENGAPFNIALAILKWFITYPV